MWLVVGLGNPGVKYAGTRHNIGFMVLDRLAKRSRVSFNNQFKAEVARSDFASERVIFLKPQTFMNLSGDSVQPAAAFFKVPPENIIVVHDDIDLQLGQLKLKLGGGHGGHNGLRDINKRLGPDFLRVRAGVGRPVHQSGAVHSHVLGRFADKDAAEVEILIDKCCGAVELLVTEGLKAAQNRFQEKKKKTPKKPKEARTKPSDSDDEASSARKPAVVKKTPIPQKESTFKNGFEGLRSLFDKKK